MNGNELLKRLKKLAEQRDQAMQYDPTHGKGSHGALLFGDRRTTLKDPRKEIPPRLLGKMLKDLGLSRKDLGL